MPSLTLHTPRLKLRPWKQSDLALFASINANPQVMEFFPALLSKEESDALAEKIQQEFAVRRYGLWAVEVPGEAEFIGFIGLHYPSFEADFTPCVEVGWRLAPDYWGKGYATEGARAALEYGFQVLQLPEIVSFTYQGNMRSRRVMERLGMQHDSSSDFDHPLLQVGHPLRPHVLYRLSQSNFEKAL